VGSASPAKFVERSKHDGALAWHIQLHPQSPPKHSAHAAKQFPLGTAQEEALV